MGFVDFWGFCEEVVFGQNSCFFFLCGLILGIHSHCTSIAEPLLGQLYVGYVCSLILSHLSLHRLTKRELV